MSQTSDMVHVVTVSDYFGEVSLFLKTELHYTVRAKMHLDRQIIQSTQSTIIPSVAECANR